jgi:flagellar basal body-associated protein FliL
MILPAVLAGAAGFVGAYFGAPKAPGHTGTVEEEKIPGPTVDLEPFVLNVLDEKTGDQHAMKIRLQIELAKGAIAEQFTVFVPRTRDTFLAYLRGLSYSQAKDYHFKERISEDLLDRLHKLGAENAIRVLITDIVLQ